MATVSGDGAGGVCSGGIEVGRRGRFAAGWRIQTRVIRALMIRELSTRFGRENIGFLWMMVEPLMFAVLVGFIWTFLRGRTEQGGIATAAFIASGYIPLTLFRHIVGRAVGVFTANANLMYHRQIQILDFILVRFFIEVIGAMMAFVFIDLVLHGLGLMPLPQYPAWLLLGWSEYCLFSLSLAMILAPLSERSEVWEKIIPVTTYVMIPFSGCFTLNEWLTPAAREYMVYSPFVDAMEMFRYGVFGDEITPIYNPWVPVLATLVLLAIGLVMCRRARRTLVVE